MFLHPTLYRRMHTIIIISIIYFFEKIMAIIVQSHEFTTNKYNNYYNKL